MGGIDRVMYKLLLVEDEKILLEDLVENVDWGSMDIEVIGTAWNGRDAIEKVNELKPDIIIADIKMPVMDGLELAKQIKKIYDDIQIIFLTGFDELDYVKTALEVEAIGYLLKPFNFDEVQQMISKAKKRLLACRQAELGRRVQDEADIRAMLYSPKDYMGDIESEFVIMVAAIDNYRLVMKDKEKYEILDIVNGVQSILREMLDRCGFLYKLVPLEGGEFFIAVALEHEFASLNTEKWRSINGIVEERYGITISIGLCDRYVKVTDFADAYHEAISALNYRFYQGHAQIINSATIKMHSKGNQYRIPEVENALVDAVYHNRRMDAINILENYFELLRTEKVQREAVIAGIFNLVDRLYEYFLKLSKEMEVALNEKGRIFDIIECYDNIPDMHDYVRQLLQSIFDQLCIEEDVDYFRKIAMKIMQYLEANYMKPVTIEDVAKELCFSPSRLRKIFKDYTGTTIHDYLTNIRMKKSLQLMRDPAVRIKDIATSIGYENISYFCTLFAKYYGMSPNQYRNKILGR